MKTKRPIILCITILLGACVIGLAVNLRKAPGANSKPVKADDKQLVYDTVLLKKFSSLLQLLNFNKPSFTYEGKFNITDGRDSSGNVHNLAFLYCREGKYFYSKVGNNEVVNDKGVNIYIENETKKIVVSGQQININPAMTGLQQVIEKARSEGYTLSSSASGSIEKISLLNEHHVSCKELSVTYNALNQKLNTVLLRYSDIGDPLNKTKDRKVEIELTRIEADTHLKKYPGIKDIIKEADGKLTLKPAYAAYELITL